MITIEIFKLFGSIFVDNEKANKSIAKTDEKAQGLGSRFGAGVKKAAKWGAGIAVAAGAAGAAMFGLASKAAATTDRIDKMSQKIGISRTGFQEWDFILSQSGTDIEKMQSGMKTLVQRMDESTRGTGIGSEAFKRLKLDAIDPLTGSLKTQEQMFEETVKALQAMPAGAEKSRLAFELFGKAGTELMPLLNSTGGSVEELKAKASELGLVISDEAVDAGVKFTDALDQMKRATGAVFTKIGVALMPLMQQFSEWIIQHMPQIQFVFSTVFRVIGFLVDGFVKGIKLIIKWVKQWVGDNSEQLAVIQELFMVFFEAVQNFITAFVEFAIAFWDEFGVDIMDLTKTATDFIFEIIETAFTLITDIFNIFSDLFKGDWEALWGDVGKFFDDIWEGMYKGLKSTINLILKAINFMVRQMNKIHFSIPGWVPGLGGKSWGFNLPEIPLLAKGGEILKSGHVIVGDAGPEMLELPEGAKVKPLDKIDKGIDYKRLGAEIATAVYEAIIEASKQTGGQEAKLEIDGTKLARLLIPKIISENHRLGVEPV